MQKIVKYYAKPTWVFFPAKPELLCSQKPYSDFNNDILWFPILCKVVEYLVLMP